MIKFENTEVVGWEHAIRGMRNPMNSWEKSDSDCTHCMKNYTKRDCESCGIYIGLNDLDLMKRLRNAGTDHRKFMRMITAYVDITAPLYWWKEFDTYKVGTVANSCSTMHKIHAKEFTLEDFSCEHLLDFEEKGKLKFSPLGTLQNTIDELNDCRKRYLETKDKRYWWQMIQLLPSSYNQKRTVMLNYEVLANIYKSRKNHKLDEWAEHSKGNDEIVIAATGQYGFCDWIKTLPYSELITGEQEKKDETR